MSALFFTPIPFMFTPRVGEARRHGVPVGFGSLALLWVGTRSCRLPVHLSRCAGLSLNKKQASGQQTGQEGRHMPRVTGRDTN